MYQKFSEGFLYIFLFFFIISVPRSRFYLFIFCLLLVFEVDSVGYGFQISRPEDFEREPDPKKYFVQFFGTQEM